MSLGPSYRITVGTRLRKTLAAALILSLCTLAFVARDVQAQVLTYEREEARQQRQAAKFKPAKTDSKATAGTTSTEAPPAQAPPAEMAPSTPEAMLEPTPEASTPMAFELMPAPDLVPEAWPPKSLSQ